MRINSDQINLAMRALCKKRFRRKNIDPDIFVAKFKELHPDLVEEMKDHAFDFWFKDKARKLLKNTAYDLRKARMKTKNNPHTNELSQMLPLRVQVEGKTISIWVKRKDANLKELIAYKESLGDNAKACAEKLDKWDKYLKLVKPLLLNNSEWKAGDAENYLIQQGDGIIEVIDKAT